MLRKISWLAGIALFLFFLVSCGDQEKPEKISLEKREFLHNNSLAVEQQSLRVAVGGIITPKAGFAYYLQFLNYLGEKLDIHVQFIVRESYAEINRLIMDEKVDLAFVCGGPYVSGHDQFGMELLVAPRSHGGTVYYSYIIIPQESAAQQWEDLRGKRFVFTDPLSNTGKLVPTYMLARMEETPGSFFADYNFSGSHDKSIKAIAYGLADGAAVDSLIWEYLQVTDPALTARTKVMLKSPPYGIPPVVVRPNLSPELKNELRQIFLTAHLDPQGKEILAKMMIEQFVPIDNAAYDSIREMMSWVEAQDADKEER
ncbi:MAG: phosphate/phosphite/phosphonate ABC transporter substrate-binding protein [Desulfoarculaceae bacterium]|nr:phosphate/phosphite/phosphonate ABC transporter substrate-binding protein [Desulfoarculaceae bacterium]